MVRLITRPEPHRKLLVANEGLFMEKGKRNQHLRLGGDVDID